MIAGKRGTDNAIMMTREEEISVSTDRYSCHISHRNCNEAVNQLVK